MTRFSVKPRIIVDESAAAEPLAKERAIEEERFREIEEIYLSGILRGIAERGDTRH